MDRELLQAPLPGLAAHGEEREAEAGCVSGCSLVYLSGLGSWEDSISTSQRRGDLENARLRGQIRICT